MKHSPPLRNTTDRPSYIVRIAYHQLSMMSGIKDPTEPPKVDESQNDRNGDKTTTFDLQRSFRLGQGMITSQIFNAYASLKNSNESVASILNSFENGLKQGMQYVSPLTEKINSTDTKEIREKASLAMERAREKLDYRYFEEKLKMTCDFFRPVLDYFRWLINVSLPSLTNDKEDKARINSTGNGKS